MIRSVLGALALLTLSGGAALAQGSAADWEGCESGYRDDAIKHSTAIIDTPGVPPQRLAVAYYKRGRAYPGRERDKAIADYSKAIELNPRYADALVRRATAWRDAGEPHRAIDDYDKLLALDPKDADVLNDRGNAWRALHQIDRALQDYDKAIRLKPNHHIAFFNRGNALMIKGEYQRAIADYDKAIRLNRDYDQAYIHRCYARAIVGELEAALPDCERILSQWSFSADAREVRGFIHLKAGRLDAAIADYDVAIELNPKRAAAFYGRGLARQRKGDAAGGAADIAAARAIKADIAEQMARYGLR